jgi:hypothetical protein
MRVLLYNRSKTFKLSYSQNMGDHLLIEEVQSFSGAFSRIIFERKREDGSDPYDCFLVYAEVLGSDLINFLKYIKQNKPTLRIIVLVDSNSCISAMKFHFSDVMCLIPKNGIVEDILDLLKLEV